jgi:hypothetical protein
MFVHPTSPACSCSSLLDQRYPRPRLEFIFETTRSISDLVLLGVLERFPNLAPLIEEIRKFGARGGDISAQLGDLAKQQKHLVYWLDKQTDALQVGLRFECPGSEFNSEVQRWRGEQKG